MAGQERAALRDAFVLGKHMMFRKYPEKFNAALDAFLEADPE
jgi:hypothetical protein